MDMTSKQAKGALIASLAVALLSVIGVLASIGRPTEPTLMVASASTNPCVPADLRAVIVNFPPNTTVALSVSIENGAWAPLATVARTDARGETDVRVPDTAQLIPTGCDPLAPGAYRFRATTEEGEAGETEATTDERPLTSFTPDWVIEPGRVPQPLDAVGAPALFLTGILGLLGMLVSGAFVAYPRTPPPPPREH